MCVWFSFFFFIYVGCPSQLTRTTTIPHGPLDILQAQEQVRHRGGDRRAHRRSNPGWGRNKSHDWPQQLDPQVFGLAFVVEVVVGYNPIIHKTQPQKLIFLTFCSFLVGSTRKPHPPPLKQTPFYNNVWKTNSIMVKPTFKDLLERVWECGCGYFSKCFSLENISK